MSMEGLEVCGVKGVLSRQIRGGTSGGGLNFQVEN